MRMGQIAFYPMMFSLHTFCIWRRCIHFYSITELFSHRIFSMQKSLEWFIFDQRHTKGAI